MAQIDTRALRDFRTTPAHAIAIALALAVVMMMPTGLEMALRSLIQGRDHYASQLALADLEVRMLPEDVRNLPDWREVPGLERVETRLLMPGTLQLPDGRTISALTIFLRSDAPQINKLRLLSGAPFRPGEDEAVIDRAVSVYGDVREGQVVRVRVGQKTYEHRVTGIASSPEFLMVAANPEYFLPEKGSLAVLYTSLDRVYQGVGFTMVNDLLFRYSPGADVEGTKRAVMARLGGRTIERVIPRAEHLSIKHLDLDREIFGIFQPAIAVVLSLLAAALVIINVDRLVRRQERELGALLALGYTPSRIVASYLLATLALSLGGVALGALGSIAFRDAFLRIYSTAHGLAYVETHLYWSVLARGAGLVTVLAVASALLACRRLLRATPLALMRPPPPRFTPASGPFRLVVRAVERYPLGVRLGVRNVLRHHRLTLTTVFTVGLALAVAIAYLVCLDSMDAAISRSFETQRWSRAVSFLYPTLEDDYSALAGGSPSERVEPFVRAQGQILTPRRTLDTSVLGIASSGSLRSVHLIAGRLGSAPGEVVVSEDTARRLGVGVGSDLTLVLRNQRLPARIVGVKSDVLLSETLVPLEWARRVLELEDQATGAFVVFAPGALEPAKDGAIAQLDFVGRSTSRARMVGEFRKILQDIRKLVLLVAAIALAVAVLFIVMGITMTMSERAGEFAVLRAMGYGPGLIRQALMTEAILQVLLALVVTGPASYALAGALNRRASEAWFAQPTVYSPRLLIAIACGVLVLTMVSLMGPIRELRRTNVAQGLRERVIE